MMIESYTCDICANTLSLGQKHCGVCGWTPKFFDPLAQPLEYSAYGFRLREARDRWGLLGKYDLAVVSSECSTRTEQKEGIFQTHMIAIGAALV